MSEEKFKQIEKLLGRELPIEDKERLHRIKDVLHISDHDAVWDLLAAMEYQRVYYEELPAKIAGASADILKGISPAADKEVTAVQGRLAKSIAEQAKKLSVRINPASLLPMGLTALICLLLFGSLLMWAGYRIGSGQASLLRMPSCILMGGLCIAGGDFLGIHAARAFAEGKKAGISRRLPPWSCCLRTGSSSASPCRDARGVYARAQARTRTCRNLQSYYS